MLSRGAYTITSVAHDSLTHTRCVVKRLSVREAFARPEGLTSLEGSDAQKIVELFRREATVLKRLEHPAIPRFIDFFTKQTTDDVLLYLVQEYVDAPSLAALLEKGRVFGEAEAARIGERLAEVLVYLHGLSPPVIHRDLKPSNVLYAEDGRVFLVDFGAAKDRLRHSALDGATIIGTKGYMPVEQYEGDAVPSSDLYALGATLAAILTGKEPSELVRRKGRPDLGAERALSPGFGRLIGRLLEPRWEARLGSAKEARELLGRVATGEIRTRIPTRRLAAATILALAVGGVSLLPVFRTGAPTALTIPRAPRAPASARSRPAIPAPRSSNIVIELEKVPESESRRQPWREPAESVTGVFRWPTGFADSISRVQMDEGGNVWVLNGSQAVRYQNGSPDDRQEMHPWQSRSEAVSKRSGERTPFTVKTGFATKDKEIWIAGWRGQIARLGAAGWEMAGDAFREPVTDIAVYRGRVLVASRGRLLAWDTAANVWAREFPDDELEQTNVIEAVPNGPLLVGGSKLRAYSNGTWSVVASTPHATALHRDVGGRTFVGTDDGLVTLDATGKEIARDLAGRRIRGIATTPSRGLWVGTWGDGLHYRDGASGRWYRFSYAEGLTGDEVVSVVVDRRGRLWGGLWGGGVFVADASAAEAFLRRNPPRPSSPGRVYATAAVAVTELLSESERDGGVTWREAEGQKIVFFGPRLVHPTGYRLFGSLLPDRRMALLGFDWKGKLYLGRQATTIPPPVPQPASQPVCVLLDTKGRVWAGTNRDGLFLFEGGAWRRIAELPLVPYRGLVEGPDGAIWVTTLSYSGTKRDEPTPPSLHRFDGVSWAHFGAADGVPFPDVNAVLVRKSGEIAVGTSGGLALFSPQVDSRSARATRFRVRSYKRDTGLPQEMVASLSESPDGRLWLSHLFWGAGVTWFDGSAFHRVDSRQGLFASKIAASAHDAKGNVWLLAEDGRVGIYPAESFAE